MPKKLILAVNGYGAAADPVADQNTHKYLSFILRSCYEWPDRSIELHLLGGNTNRRSITEARAMKIWFDAHAHPPNLAKVVLHEAGLDLRGNVISLRGCIQPEDEVVYFCEESRRFTTEFLVHRYLGRRVQVKDLGFDPKALTLRHRLIQRFPKFWLEWLAEMVGWPFEGLRRRLRQRHIAKHRRLAGEDP